jgi:hypothetical protein
MIPALNFRPAFAQTFPNQNFPARLTSVAGGIKDVAKEV